LSFVYGDDLPLPEIELKALGFEAKGEYRKSYEAYLEATKRAIENGLEKAKAGEDDSARGFWAAAEVYLHRTCSLFSQMPNPDYNELASALSGLDSETNNPVFAGYLKYHLLQALLRCGRVESAKQVADSIGLVRHWFIIGPFDNEQGAGFEERYPPEEKIDFGQSCKGKRRQVNWRVLPCDAPLPIIDLDVMLRPNDQVLAYAAAFVRSPKSQDAAIRFGTDEGFKLFVNGKQVTGEEIKRRFEFDQNVVAVHLSEGWNVIMLKVTEYKGEWKFCARLTAPDGTPLSGLEYAKDFEQASSVVVAPYEESKVKVERGARDYYEELLAKDGENFIALFHLAYLHIAYHWLDESVHKDRVYLEKLVSKYNESPILWFFAAQSHIEQAEEETALEENKRREYILKAIELDNGYVEALHSLAEYYLSRMRNWKEAEKFNEQALRVNPNYFRSLEMRLAIQKNRNFTTEAQASLQKLYESGKEGVSDSFVVLKNILPSLEEKKKSAEMKRICETVLSKDAFAVWARTALVNRLQEEGNFTQATRVVAELLRLNPYDIESYKRLGQIYKAQDRLEEAVLAFEKLLDIAPEDEDGLTDYGKLLLQLSAMRNETKEGPTFKKAVGALERLLEVNPNNVWARRYLEFAGAREKPYEELERFVDSVSVSAEKIVIEEGVLTKKGEEYTVEKKVTEFSVAKLEEEVQKQNTPLQVILSKRIINVNKNGTASEFHHFVVRVGTDKGAELIGKLMCEWFSSWGLNIRVKEARIYRKEGQVEEATVSGSYIMFPKPEIGDVCEFSFRGDQEITDVSERYFGDYYGAILFFNDSSGFNRVPGWITVFYSIGGVFDYYPVKICKVSLILPLEEDRKVFYHCRNTDVKPVEEVGINERTRVLSWRLTDLPEAPKEKFAPPDDQTQPVLYLSTFGDWKEFGKWFSHLVQRQYESSDALKDKALELTKDCKTDMEKVRALYNFVANRIRYEMLEVGVYGWKPYKASTIFQREIGDCKDKALLFCVMMKEVGLTAYPVIIRALVSGGSRGKPDLTLPMVEHFNHCIAYVPKTETIEEMWLDLTAQGYSFSDSPPEGDRGTQGLIVTPEGSYLKELPYREPEKSIQSAEVDVEVKPDGSASAKFKLTMSALHSSIVRTDKYLSNEGMRKLVLEYFLSQVLPGSKVSDIEMPDLTNPDINPLVWGFKADVPSILKTTSEGIVLYPHIFLLELTKEMAQTATRKYPVSLPLGFPVRSLLFLYLIPGATVEQHKFSLDGYRIKSIPKDFILETSFAKAEIIYSKKDDSSFTFTRRLVFKKPYVEVSEYQDEYRNFFVELDKQNQMRVLLEKIEQSKETPKEKPEDKKKEDVKKKIEEIEKPKTPAGEEKKPQEK